MMRNPIFESSTTRRMRSYRAPLLISLYVAFLAMVSVTSLVILQRSEVSLGDLRSGLEAYTYICTMQFFLIVLVAPALTAGSIAGERERQTMDLLLCTRVGAMSIVWGKLLSSVCFIALMVASSLPIMAITLFFGGVTLWDMLVMLLFLAVTALACSAVGILCSAVFKRTVTATVVAYLSIFGLGIGTVLLPLLFQGQLLTDLSDALNSFTGGYQYAGTTAIIISSTGGTASIGQQAMQYFPKLFYMNPAIGLVSLLMNQTGLLQNTISSLFGYRGNTMFRVLEVMASFTFINMGVLAALSVVLTAVAALFVKPEGLRARKKK